jgi:hypothetical protein
MATDLIRYDLLVQDALRGVVREVLTQAAKNGLQGDHHFFITFRTNAPGLRLSNRMRTRYPEEMTVILQHQFWDLSVTEHAFEVGLSFSNVPERLLVPFAAITSFVDPSVQFGLKFEVKDDTAAANDATEESSEPAAEPLKSLPGKRALAAVEASEPATRQDAAVSSAKAKPTPVAKPARQESEAPAKLEPAEAKTPEDEGGATKVVSIDAFRKKP